tara:strand:- start:268 stop:534 length:267 start_codon:yes stop_codon:yes gene_type:complete
MIKALMVITMVTGTTYEVKLPSMEQCMAERAPVEVQGDVESTACIPRTENEMSTELFNRWLDVILQVQEQKQWTEPCNLEEDYYPPKP